MRAYSERIMKTYPKFKFAEWIKENNQYYLPEENLLDGDWYIQQMPTQLQKYIVEINDKDWTYGIEYNELIQILESELNFYLNSGNYNIENNEKSYWQDFLGFCYANGWKEAFGEDENEEEFF